MKSKAIHQHDDWYLIQLPGYGDIPKDELQVDIKVTDIDLINMDYKAIRGAMILDRYEEKLERNDVEVVLDSNPTVFLQHFNIEPINSMEDLMKVITILPKRNDIYTR
jgi:hypothetical protein